MDQDRTDHEKRSPLSLPRVRLALVGIPLCVLGIFLIFYLKPTSGDSVRGLAILTAVLQAFGAAGIVLFFTALLEYLKDQASHVKIERRKVPEKELLLEAHRIGAMACIDTCPHPEHKEEWVETVSSILNGSLQDLLEHYYVSQNQIPKIIREIGIGTTELLQRQHEERASYSLSAEDVIALLPQVLERIREFPDHGISREEEERPDGNRSENATPS